MTVAIAAAFPSDAVAALVAEVGANPCAVFDTGDHVTWANAAGRHLIDSLGHDAFGGVSDRRGAMATGRVGRKRFEIGPLDARRAFTARFSPIAGQPDQVFCAVADVTGETRALKALREVTQRANELMSLVSDCIWETDQDWCLRHFTLREADAAAARAFVGRGLFEIGTFAPASTGNPRPPTKRHRALFRDVAFRVCVGDAERVFLLSGIPLFDTESGAFLGYRGTGNDVTQRQRAEGAAEEARQSLVQTLEALSARNAELDAALVAAQAADAAKDEFLARMSHELRTPLNAVMGLSAVLKHSVADRVDDQHIRFLDEINSAGRHLLALVSDVLDVSRGRLADVTLALEPCDLGAIADEALAFLRIAAGERGMTLTLETDADLALVADATRLRQVFINLLGNAVKFSPDGGTVSVRVQRDAARFCVEIRDEGPGIEPALRERVFDPFYQIDGSATRKHGGAGLGLALCRQFVRLHGGDIQIDSGEPSGTLVRFWLPVPTVTSRSEETGMRLSLAAASLG